MLVLFHMCTNDNEYCLKDVRFQVELSLNTQCISVSTESKRDSFFLYYYTFFIISLSCNKKDTSTSPNT